MFGVDHTSTPLNLENFGHHQDYLYAFDLFNSGYYWESHVWWEELWHLAGRKGQLADLLKALIKLAAAGVKLKLGQETPTQGHLERALELIRPMAASLSESFYGVNLQTLESDIKKLTKAPQELFQYQIQLENVADIL